MILLISSARLSYRWESEDNEKTISYQANTRIMQQYKSINHTACTACSMQLYLSSSAARLSSNLLLSSSKSESTLESSSGKDVSELRRLPNQRIVDCRAFPSHEYLSPHAAIIRKSGYAMDMEGKQSHALGGNIEMYSGEMLEWEWMGGWVHKRAA